MDDQRHKRPVLAVLLKTVIILDLSLDYKTSKLAKELNILLPKIFLQNYVVFISPLDYM